MAKTKTTKKKAPIKKTPTKKTVKKKKADDSPEVKIDRRVKAERRSSEDRRQQTVAVENDRRQTPDRRKVSRRRQIDPTTCERDYNGEEIEFMQALDAYKRAAGRMFPTCSEILEVIRDLGYRRLSPEEIASLRPTDANASAEAAESTSSEEDEHDSEDPLEQAFDEIGG